jgi:hypothetical protein
MQSFQHSIMCKCQSRKLIAPEFRVAIDQLLGVTTTNRERKIDCYGTPFKGKHLTSYR